MNYFRANIQTIMLLCMGLLLVNLATNSAHAHEHWLDTTDYNPASSTSLNFSVCSGHYFPKSSFALKDKVLQGVELLTPNGKTISVHTTITEKQRIGSIKLESEGVYVLRLTLKRPRAKKPNYEAKVIFTAGTGSDDSARYKVGRGLELVPSRTLTNLKPDDELPLLLMLDGKRVAGSIEASVQGEKSTFLKTEIDKPAVLRLTRAGRYLITTNVQGRGCSLVFLISEPKKESH